MKLILVLNRKSGSIISEKKGYSEENIIKHFKDNNIEIEVIGLTEDDLAGKIKSKIEDGFEIVAVSGGDGTISSVAEITTGTGIPLGILPSGTFNHFAKDLKIPLELEEAVKVIIKKNMKKVDVGEVNGKIFINNSSIGFYPKVVKKRIEHQRLGGSKLSAMGNAAVNVFKRYPLLKVEIKTDKEEIRCKTPFVFLGNNKYNMDILNLGSREKINEGFLNLYYPNSSNKFAMFRFAFLALINRLDQEKDFSVIITRKAEINLSRKIIDVALDGEVFHLKPPLKYKILPESLNVIVPKDNE